MLTHTQRPTVFRVRMLLPSLGDRKSATSAQIRSDQTDRQGTTAERERERETVLAN